MPGLTRFVTKTYRFPSVWSVSAGFASHIVPLTTSTAPHQSTTRGYVGAGASSSAS